MIGYSYKMRGREWLGVATGLLLALGAAGAALAEAPVNTSTNETVITSDRLNYDYRRSIAVFEGNVHVVDSRIRIRSEKLTVIFGEANTIRSVTAVGNVHLRQGDKTGTCRQAVYRARTGEVVLTGNATVSRSTDRLSGDVITFWIGEERIESIPGNLRIAPRRKSGGARHER